MKTLLRFILALGLCMALAVPAFAESKQVTALTTSAAATIIVPGRQVTSITITNVGSAAVNLTFDGGSSYGGTDPTTTSTGKGLPLQPGQTISFWGQQFQGVRIIGIMQTGTTTLNVQTNAPVGSSTFPTS